jgi:secondary thiamine-phosphate synthase enzyme
MRSDAVLLNRIVSDPATILSRQSPLEARNVSTLPSVPSWQLPCYGHFLAMPHLTTTIEISTRGPGLYEFTRELRGFVAQSQVQTGLVTAFCRHTSASLLIQENADDDVKTDLMGFFRRIAPEGMDWIVHRTEGPDDMPAHIRAALTQTSIGIPVVAGEPVLGNWQGIYLFEHRARPHRRQVVLHLSGDT